MATAPLMTLYNGDGVGRVYEVVSARNLHDKSLRIGEYGDLCISVTLTTASPMTKLSARDVNIPFRTIGPNTYIVEHVYDLSDSLLDADVEIVDVEILFLFMHADNNYKRERFMWQLVFLHEDLLYQELGLPPIQKQDPNEYKRVLTVLDQVEEIPTDVTSIIADYYNPYKQNFTIHSMELKDQTDQQYLPTKALRVAAIKYPKDANISLSFHGIELLRYFITWTDSHYRYKVFGPCDRRLIGYDPQKNDITYMNFKPENEIYFTSDKSCKVEFICL